MAQRPVSKFMLEHPVLGSALGAAFVPVWGLIFGASLYWSLLVAAVLFSVELYLWRPGGPFRRRAQRPDGERRPPDA